VDAASGGRRDGRDEKPQQSSIRPVKRLLALVAGALGIRALLRSRRRNASAPQVDELRAKLAEARGIVGERDEFEAGETPVDQVPDVDTRRADVHDRARRAIDELGEH
jgi:hypothetical protein